MAQCVQCEVDLPTGAQFCAKCGAQVVGASEPAADPYLGRVFAQKYRVEALLGEGGMGRVYRATQLSLDKQVCLKVLRRELANDPSTQARFQREARAASRLNHPNSIQVMDFGSGEAGELYLAMEYIKGQDLQQLLSAEFPLVEARICHIMAQVLDALSEAHAQHVIHRDLKPENIMIYQHRGDPNCVKVLDFGIAMIQDSATQPKLTRAGLVCGTPEYMSPEQARGNDLDARSDLYSAGVILYQMTTGSLPFNADSPMGFVTAHLNEQPIPPSARHPGISPALEKLIVATLDKQRENRPASAKEMWSALTAIERGATAEAAMSLGDTTPKPPAPAVAAPKTRPAAAPTAASLRTPPATSPQRRSGFALGIGAGVLVLASGAFAAYRLLPTRDSPALAPTAAVTLEANQAISEGKAIYFKAFAEDDPVKRRDLMTQANKKFWHALRADPSNPEPLKLMGNCLKDLGDTKGAVESYRKYTQTVPPPPDSAGIGKMADELEAAAK